MKSYYFTFGQADIALNGDVMRNYYVKVTAHSYGAARGLFCVLFAKPLMGLSDRWAFQYEEDMFDKSYFPGGEYAYIDESALPTPIPAGWVTL